MVVLVFPKGYIATDFEPSPLRAKATESGRLAAYWIFQGIDKGDAAELMWTVQKVLGSIEPTVFHINKSAIARPVNGTGPFVIEAGGLEPRATNTRQRDVNVRAVERIDFIILTALEEERDAVLAKLPSHQKLSPTDDDIRVYFSAIVPARFPDGSSRDYRVVVLSLLNMGRVEAATATADAIRRWSPRYVLLVGIAGGIAANGAALGDVLVSDQIVDYELQKLTPDGPKVRYSVHRADPRLVSAAQNFLDNQWVRSVRAKRPLRGRPKRQVGLIATGDKVQAFKDVLDAYRQDWPKLIGVEMEAGGAASAAFQAPSSPGFFMVRGVSDLADEAKDTSSVQRWRSYACDVAAAYAISLLTSGPIP
jgi:nucleoside phosphorylase